MLTPAAPAKASQSVGCKRRAVVPIDSSSRGSLIRDMRSFASCHETGTLMLQPRSGSARAAQAVTESPVRWTRKAGSRWPQPPKTSSATTLKRHTGAETAIARINTSKS